MKLATNNYHHSNLDMTSIRVPPAREMHTGGGGKRTVSEISVGVSLKPDHKA